MDNIELVDYKVQTIQINYDKIYLLSDLHFGVRSNSIEWLDNQLNYFYNFYIPYLEKTKENNSVLFILGDFFDNRQSLDINVINKSIELINDLAKILPVIFLVGNHDIYKKNDTDINSLIVFKQIHNVIIFEKPIIVTNDRNKILLLPWVGNVKKEELYAKHNKADYIFAHTDLMGFKLDNGLNINNGADLKNAAEAKRVFSGHIHKRQENGDCVYLGSPYSTKRSDIGNKKGFYIFKPNQNTYEFIPNNFSPIFQKVLLETLLELTLEQTSYILENNYTDIIVPNKYINLFNLTNFVSILEGCKYKKLEATGENSKLEDNLDNLEETNIKDIITLLEFNIDNLELQSEMKENLKVLNRKYYEKATLSCVTEDIV